MDHNTLRSLRCAVGLLQKEVADELGVDKQTVCRWESGSSAIPKDMEFAFYDLIRDDDLVREIKSARKKYVRGRPFKKNNG